MAVMRAVMLLFSLKLILIFFIKRPSFKTSNSVCYSFHSEEVNDKTATFIYESMYVLQNVKTVSSASLFEHLLLLSGDIEVCPEPTREIPELDTRD